jgi:hypothetical protein
MKRFVPILMMAALLSFVIAACDSGTTPDVALELDSGNVLGKQDKIAICHNGTETDDGGESWDLIQVGNSTSLARHLAHGDYVPAPGAGCDLACPCWVPADLEVITAANHGAGYISCSNFSTPYPDGAGIRTVNVAPGDNTSYWGFYAYTGATGYPRCAVHEYGSAETPLDEILPDEADACIAQIAARCAAVGDPMN